MLLNNLRNKAQHALYMTAIIMASEVSRNSPKTDAKQLADDYVKRLQLCTNGVCRSNWRPAKRTD